MCASTITAEKLTEISEIENKTINEQLLLDYIYELEALVQAVPTEVLWRMIWSSADYRRHDAWDWLVQLESIRTEHDLTEFLP